MKYPTTPDGRYFVVKTTLWRSANPSLSPARRSQLQKELMAARRQCRKANLATKTVAQVRAIRDQVDAAKVALGERGPVWWNDGDSVGDLNRHSVNKSPYKDWFAGLCGLEGSSGVREDQGQGGSEGEGQGPAGEKPTQTTAEGKTKREGNTTGKRTKRIKTGKSKPGQKTRTANKYGLRSRDKPAANLKEESDDD